MLILTYTPVFVISCVSNIIDIDAVSGTKT